MGRWNQGRRKIQVHAIGLAMMVPANQVMCYVYQDALLFVCALCFHMNWLVFLASAPNSASLNARAVVNE